MGDEWTRMEMNEHEWEMGEQESEMIEHEWEMGKYKWEMREDEWEMKNTNGKIGILFKIGQIWQFS